MIHIDWLRPEDVHIVRTNLKPDTFLDDIKNQKCEQLRLIKITNTYYIRYKLGRKVFWWQVFLHSKKNIYYLTPTEITDKNLKDKMNRKYLKFNRNWLIDKLLYE